MFNINGLALLFYLISSSLSAEQKIVSVVTESDYAPLMFSLENKPIRTTLAPGENDSHLDGYSWDVFRESLHIMGYSIQLRVGPWARILKEFETGEADLLFPAGKNTKRLKKFNYSQQALHEVHFLIYVCAGNPIQWQGLTHLAGLKIGVIRSYNYGDQWAAINDVEQINIGNVSTGFAMLEKGRIDGFLGYEFIWDYRLKAKSWENKFRKLPRFDSTNEYVVALKSNKNGVKLLHDFDLGLEELRKSGKLHQIKLKWSFADNNTTQPFSTD